MMKSRCFSVNKKRRRRSCDSSKSVSLYERGQRSWWFVFLDCDIEPGCESVISNNLTGPVMLLIKDIPSSWVHLIKLCDLLNFCRTSGCSDMSVWCQKRGKLQRNPAAPLYLTLLSHFVCSPPLFPLCHNLLTLSRLIFLFHPDACLMTHSCSWWWLTPAAAPHCPAVVNLFGADEQRSMSLISKGHFIALGSGQRVGSNVQE